MNSNKNIDISVVIPVYGCDESLIELYDRLTSTLKSIVKKYEIIFIDDCGLGRPWTLIKEISEKDSSVVGIRLSRNFGQHVAITAGLIQSVGDWVVVMDCDLQDKPEEIVRLYDAIQRETDIVFAQRVNRQDSYFKKISSKLFYKFFGYLTDTKLDASIANFGIFHKKVIDAVLLMTEAHKYFPVMVRWVGFSSISIPVSHVSRMHSETSYTFSKLIKLSFGIIMSFSDKPLRLIVKFGFIVSLISALYAVSIAIDVFINGASVAGWSSVMVSMWFIGGVLISIIGVVGLYVGKTFDETKSRPLYIVRDKVG
jgi:dolichol-phosphate mannosyltransferase